MISEVHVKINLSEKSSKMEVLCFDEKNLPLPEIADEKPEYLRTITKHLDALTNELKKAIDIRDEEEEESAKKRKCRCDDPCFDESESACVICGGHTDD